MIEVLWKTTCCFGVLALVLVLINSKYENFVSDNIVTGVAFCLYMLIGAGFGATIIDTVVFIYQLVKRILN